MYTPTASEALTMCAHKSRKFLFLLALTFLQACFGDLTASVGTLLSVFLPPTQAELALKCSPHGPSHLITGGQVPSQHVVPPFPSCSLVLVDNSSCSTAESGRALLMLFLGL